VEFRILGPLEVVGEAGPIDVGGRKPRGLLALLLVHANRVVSADRLIDDLWDGAPPSSAVTTLQTYVSQLRKCGVTSLRTRSTGYVLEVEPDAFDAARFEGAVTQAREREDEPDWVAARLQTALGWWRGAPLLDFADAPWARLEAARLESLRLDGLGDWFDARLALGQHRALATELQTVVAAHPFHERFWARWMLALYRSDRQADALRAFRKLREHLGEELGIEPSADVVRLEEAILLQKAELDWQAPAAPVRRGPSSNDTGFSAPTGTVTFLLTDVVGSTPLWHTHPVDMGAAISRHDTLIAEAVGTHGGLLLKHRGEGDSTFSVFTRATDAVEAAVRAQATLDAEPWPARIPLKVRIAIHTGEAIERDGDYYGSAVNRAARLRELAGGGQVLVSQATAELVRDALPGTIGVVELGAHAVRGLPRPEIVFALISAGGLEPTAAGPRLEVGDDGGDETIPLLGERLTIGRSRANDVALVSDHGVSRVHALFERVASGWCVCDLGSRNGTLVNGERVEASRALREGDTIVISGWRAVFRDSPDGDSAITEIT
jgi:DNA-binding SARP family transcriptional activator